MDKRESLSGRLGFILISAGCAIGIGNIYRFPIITGYYGGGFFVLFYILFLVILGFPIMTMELSVGRKSQASLGHAFENIEKPKQKWHIWKYFAIAGNYVLMMCYTTIVAWLLIYFIRYIDGDILAYKTTAELGNYFGTMVTTPWIQIVAVAGIIIAGFGVCAFGLKNGVEKVTKVLMLMLFLIIIGMGIYCLTLDGAAEGLKFYLVPSAERLMNAGIVDTISAAMAQAFFTLSLGIGSIGVFGSYIDKKRSLGGEATIIIILDTLVAMLSGLIIFPACFTFAGGVNADGGVGASFVFTTFAGIFNNMAGGRILGIIFFLLLLFAAFSTVIAVFENIMSYWLDTTKLKRPIVAAINAGILIVLSLPCILSNNVLSGLTIAGKNIMDMEDFVVSYVLLPIGSMVYCLFCTSKFGWGFDNYLLEANTGKGLKISKKLGVYMKYVLPLIILAVTVLSLITYFK